MPDPVDALGSECELLSELVLGLPEEGFAGPTRLPEWNVKELLGHVCRGVDRISTALDNPSLEATDADSISYWRTYDDDADIADRAKEFAAGYDSGQALAAAWDQTWRRALGRAADAPRERIVVTWGPALTFDQYLRTRVLEATVHRMDLNDALGLPADPTDDALAIVEEILIGLLDPRPPRTSPVGGVAFVEIGTGRRQPTDGERAALGDLADRFPLLR
jgi:uncharacterized protein (TIGR03083 family)